MKKNLIRAHVLTGKYKDKDVELEIGEDSSKSKIMIDGKDIGSSVFGIHLHIRVGQLTTLIIEKYARDGEE